MSHFQTVTTSISESAVKFIPSREHLLDILYLGDIKVPTVWEATSDNKNRANELWEAVKNFLGGGGLLKFPPSA